MFFETWSRRRLLGLVACLSLVTSLNVTFSWWYNRQSQQGWDGASSAVVSPDALAVAKRLRIISGDTTYADSTTPLQNCSSKPTEVAVVASAVIPSEVLASAGESRNPALVVGLPAEESRNPALVSAEKSRNPAPVVGISAGENHKEDRSTPAIVSTSVEPTRMSRASNTARSQEPVKEAKQTVQGNERRKVHYQLASKQVHWNTTVKDDTKGGRRARLMAAYPKKKAPLNGKRRVQNSTVLSQSKTMKQPLKPSIAWNIKATRRNSRNQSTIGLGTRAAATSTSRTVENCGNGTNNYEATGGHLISLDYDQQMMGAFKAFYHLAVLASFFNLSIVEPHIYRNGRLGVPIVASNGRLPQFLKLTDLYDCHQLKCTLRSCAKTDLVSFEEFTQRAAPNIIFVSFLTSLKGYEAYFSRGEKIVEIDNITEKLSDGLLILNEWTKYQLKQKPPTMFTLSRIILIDARPQHSISLSEIKQKLGSVLHRQREKYGRATIVLDNWRDIGGPNSPYLYSINGFSSTTCPDLFTAAHSTTVTRETNNFRKGFTHPIIGVHIRGEKLLINSKSDPSYYTHCLQQLRELLEGGTIPNVTNTSVALFHDLGKYGSNSCHHYNECRAELSNFLSQIKYFGYRVVSYDPSHFRPVHLRGVFAAFVENNFLSHADILVTVGLGNYQQNIVDRFLKHSGGVADNLYRVCSSPHNNM